MTKLVTVVRNTSTGIVLKLLRHKNQFVFLETAQKTAKPILAKCNPPLPKVVTKKFLNDFLPKLEEYSSSLGQRKATSMIKEIANGITEEWKKDPQKSKIPDILEALDQVIATAEMLASSRSANLLSFFG